MCVCVHGAHQSVQLFISKANLQVYLWLCLTVVRCLYTSSPLALTPP